MLIVQLKIRMHIRFLSPTDTSLANTETALIEALRTEILKRPGVFEASSVDAADALFLHEPWAFREWRYVDRLVADPIIGLYAHKIYTVNTDDAAAGLLRGIYTCLKRSRFDPTRHAAIPFMAQPNDKVARMAGTPRPLATLLATWRGNPKSNRKIREELLKVCAKSSAFQVETTESWLDHGPDEKRRYVDLLRSGMFSLCPSGWAPASMRIFESMALGVAPVILADEFVEPEGPDWSVMSVKIQEDDLSSLQQRLESRAADYLAMGDAAHQAWREYFHYDSMVSYYANALLTLIQDHGPGESPAAEFARWRSPQMARLNGWTLPQRIANRLTRVIEKVRV